jgi:alkaline phosphatase
MVRLSLTAALLSLAVLAPNAVAQVQDKRSAVFLHPDGMGANTWTAIRLKEVGPDGRLAWDQLPAAAAYVGPLLDRVTATSNGGGTSHAWGVRAASASFGFPAGAEAASGAPMPLMLEAKRAGKAIAIINSASVTDAGTGTQLASVGSRRNHTLIAAKMLSAEPDLLLGGGEKYFLPQGVAGVHGQGVRQDGRNLIEEARAKGYRIVRTRTELLEAAKTKGKILGLFSTDNTFQEGSEEQVAASGKPLFEAQAPRYDEMVAGLESVIADPNPVYVRFNSRPAVVQHAAFEWGKAEVFSPEAKDVALLVYGTLFTEAYEAKKLLETAGISARLVNLRTIKPLDEKAV